jgi:predicted cupin superfamily sugar epimerase
MQKEKIFMTIARPDVETVKRLIGLVPHPREGGWFVRTYESDERIVTAERYNSPRLTGTAIYYLLEPGTFSEMHRLQSDEIFHFYLGDPVEMVQLFADGSGVTVRLGTNLAGGEKPQHIVKRGVWQGSRLAPDAPGEYGFALLGCTVAPGFEFEDYEDAGREELIAQWPQWSEKITALTRR